MIGRSEEYEKMFRLEGQLWWYRSLHERVLDAVEQHAGGHRSISILDAGCGTGGLLDFLRQHGYANLHGIDGSDDAVAFCHERGLAVTFVDLNSLASFQPDSQYDAIICNDVFCYFPDPDLQALLTALSHRLKPNGVLISNNNAFNVFKGQHDLAVGIVRRFTLADFDHLLPITGLRVRQSTYWSFVLSPMILAMRQWQRLQLRLGWRTPDEAQSDVYLPSAWLNETLHAVVRAEQKILRRTPFGSSLFMVIDRGGTLQRE